MKKFSESIAKIFDDFFKDEELESIYKQIDKLFKDFGDNCNSYSSTVIDRYEDGELVSHRKKVIKDGKVITDEGNCIESKCDKNKGIECDGKCDKSVELKNLEQQIAALQSEVKALQDTVKEREKENYTLKKKLEAIKEMF